MHRLIHKFRSVLLKSAVIPLADSLMNTKIKYSYDLISELQKYSSEDIVLWQSQKLRNLIKHAYENTLYYHDLFTKLKIIPSDIKSIKDLKLLPPLTKNDIRLNYQGLLANNLDNIPHQHSSTGGSSGDPLVFVLDNNSWSYSNGNIIYNWEKLGYKYGDRYIALGSTSLFIDKKKSLKHAVYYRLKNKVGLNGVNMSDEVCENYINLIKREKIRFIYGYASSIYLLAKYVLKKNIKINLETCFPTSEICTEHYKNSISSAFNCKVLDCYGAHDGGITAFEHRPGRFEVGYNSIINYDEHLTLPQPIYLTDLFNYAMPMINYGLGDEVIISHSPNVENAFNGQVINKVVGRSSELIEFDNGSVLTGPGFTILFKDLPVEFYSILKSGGNSIICKITPLESFTDVHEKIILETVRNQVGDDVKVRVVITDKILTGQNGKLVYFSKSLGE